MICHLAVVTTTAHVQDGRIKDQNLGTFENCPFEICNKGGKEYGRK